MEDIIVVGFGGHAKSVIDSIIRTGQYNIIGFTDVVPRPEYRGIKYLGKDNVLQEYFDNGIKKAFITIGYLGKDFTRDLLYNQIKSAGFQIPVIIDSSAVIAEDVTIGEGTFIGKGCIVNSAVEIREMCIINTGSILEHESQIGAFSHVSVNSTLCGNVFVDEHCFIGANTTVIQNLKIGARSVVGAGSLVLRNVLPDERIFGIIKNVGE